MTLTLVVIGGAGLLGSAISIAAAQQGYNVVVGDFDSQRTDLLVKEIKNSQLSAEGFALDVTSPESIKSLIAFCVKKYDRIDSVVNASYVKGKGYGNSLSSVAVEDFCSTVSLQMGSVFSVYQQFSKYFLTVGAGSVVTIGSVYGSIAPKFSIYEGTDMTMPVEYAVTKSALIHLNKYFSQVFKKKGVRFNIVSPGGILDRQPAKFVESYASFAGRKGMLSPSDIVGAVMYLVSPDSSYVTGQEIIVDDGFSL